MTKPKHTPLPWFQDGKNVWHKQQLIAAAANTLGDDLSRQEAKENAALIVRAVNNHYQLLEACKEMLEILQANCDCGVCGPCKLAVKTENLIAHNKKEG